MDGHFGGTLACSKCAEPLELDYFMRAPGPFCLLCGKVFCGRHLMIRKGVGNCEACDEDRHRREQASGVSPAEQARVVGLLVRDLASTVGPGHESVVEEAAARILLFTDGPDYFEHEVVDDVQQTLHDTFVDTSWPRCPEHPHHPLWYLNKSWTCQQSGRQIAALGGLAAAPK